MVRTRKTDLLGLIGLALLLAWTPAYYAQDEVQQDLTNGTSFRLAPPRDGDRAVLELQIRERGGAVQVFGPILELSFHALDPVTSPSGASAAFTTIHHAMRFDTDLVTYASNGSTQSIHLDADGRVLYEVTAGPKEIEDVGQMVTLEEVRGRRPTDCTLTLPHELASTRFHYHPDPGAAYFRHTWQGIIEDDDPLDGCRSNLDRTGWNTLNVVAENGGHLLYGRHLLRSDRLVDRYTAPAGNAPLETCTIGTGDTLIRSHGDNDHWGPIYRSSYALDDLLPSREIRFSCDIRTPEKAWHWISPDFPYPIGAHRELFDANGDPLLTIDLVARTIERGDGAPIRLTEPPAVLRAEEAATPTSHDPPRLPTIALRDLERNDGPLVHGITYADLREALEGSTLAPQDLVQNAHLVAYEWDADGPQTKSGERIEPAPIPLPTRPINEPLNRTDLSSAWSVTYATDDGDAVQCHILFSIDETTGRKDARVHGGCAPATVDLAGADWDRRLVAPTALIGDLPRVDPDADWVTAPPAYTKSEFGWDGTGEEPSASWGVWHLPYDGTNRHVSIGTYDLWTGQRASEFSREIIYTPLEEPSEQQPTSASSTTQIIEPLTQHLALGGMLLVAISLLARLVSGLKSGTLAAGAVSLYAKIHKDALLDNDRRDAILALIQSDPGSTLREVQTGLGYGWGSTVHHVETLLRNGLLVDLPLNRRRHLFPAHIPLRERRRIAAERDPDLQSVLTTVQAHPGLSLRELLTHVDRPESALSRVGSRLVALGLVEKRKTGRTVRFYPKAI